MGILWWGGWGPLGWGRAPEATHATWLHAHLALVSLLLAVDFLRNLFSQTLGLGTQKERLLDELTLEGVSRYIQSDRCKSGALPLLQPQATPYPKH